MRGAWTVADVPEDPIRIICGKCGRRGRYRRATLLARFGPDAGMPNVLSLIADCSRRGNPSDPCLVRYEGLTYAPK